MLIVVRFKSIPSQRAVGFVEMRLAGRMMERCLWHATTVGFQCASHVMSMRGLKETRAVLSATLVISATKVSFESLYLYGLLSPSQDGPLCYKMVGKRGMCKDSMSFDVMLYQPNDPGLLIHLLDFVCMPLLMDPS